LKILLLTTFASGWLRCRAYQSGIHGCRLFLVPFLDVQTPAFKPISKAAVLREGRFEGMSAMGGSTQNWAPIALADGKLLIRDQNRMLCVKVVK